MSNIILLEDRNIYDGWIARYFIKEKKIVWRDHYKVESLSEKFKKDWGKKMLIILNKQFIKE